MCGFRSISPVLRQSGTGMKEVYDRCSVGCSTVYPEKFSGRESAWGSSNYNDDMCQIDDEDDLVLGTSAKFSSDLLSADFNKVI